MDQEQCSRSVECGQGCNQAEKSSILEFSGPTWSVEYEAGAGLGFLALPHQLSLKPKFDVKPSKFKINSIKAR